jgi:hypothetical protein
VANLKGETVVRRSFFLRSKIKKSNLVDVAYWAQSRHSGASKKSALSGAKRTSRGHTITQGNAGFHQKHGHVSRMACITPICALALHFSMCSFAHSLKASTIASFDTNDFGHAEGIDIVIK